MSEHDLVLLTGYLLRKTIPGVPPAIPLVAIPIFIFTVVTILLGQTTPLILFLIAVAWRLLEARRDRTAGFALAWLTLEPHHRHCFQCPPPGSAPPWSPW